MRARVVVPSVVLVAAGGLVPASAALAAEEGAPPGDVTVTSPDGDAGPPADEAPADDTPADPVPSPTAGPEAPATPDGDPSTVPDVGSAGPAAADGEPARTGEDPDVAEAVVTHTVTLDLGDGDVRTLEVEDGEPVLFPPLVKRIGYTLIGWYHEGRRWSVDDPVESDVVLVARWVPVVVTVPAEVVAGTTVEIRFDGLFPEVPYVLDVDFDGTTANISRPVTSFNSGILVQTVEVPVDAEGTARIHLLDWDWYPVVVGEEFTVLPAPQPGPGQDASGTDGDGAVVGEDVLAESGVTPAPAVALALALVAGGTLVLAAGRRRAARAGTERLSGS